MRDHDPDHAELARDIEEAHKSIRQMRGSIGQLFQQYSEVSAELKEINRQRQADRRELSKTLNEMRAEVRGHYENLAKLLATSSLPQDAHDGHTRGRDFLMYAVVALAALQVIGMLVKW